MGDDVYDGFIELHKEKKREQSTQIIMFDDIKQYIKSKC